MSAEFKRKLGLKTYKLPLQHWQELLSDALHSVRSLLCTATNQTPHERIFNFLSVGLHLAPRYRLGLATPGPVLIKRHVRSSKFDPLTVGSALDRSKSTIRARAIPRWKRRHRGFKAPGS